MKENKASWTAEISAIFRAVESIRPPKEQVCCDRYAKDFIRLKYRRLLNIPILARFALWMGIERRFCGTTAVHVARVRFIDDKLKESIKKGIDQVVILGAGYDTRAYRFKGLENKKVFELDHPATQKLKKEKVRRIFGKLPANTVYVPINFEQTTIDSALSNHGYERGAKTLFIWEGVTYYLTIEAIDEVLGFVAGSCGKGSSIVFDYLDLLVAKDRSEVALAKKALRYQAQKGEPFIFFMSENEAVPFLLQRGFSHVKSVSHQDLKKMYFKGKSSDRKLCSFWNIAHAIV
ncbi:MAG: class I SAM-dependent methyltransferase [Desulfobacteraceae bacterium]|nr:class I SAM-dependent methyltransferase [Desulfobacteraceae bacterium]